MLLSQFRTSAATASLKHNAELQRSAELLEVMRSSPVIALRRLWDDTLIWRDSDIWED